MRKILHRFGALVKRAVNRKILVCLALAVITLATFWPVVHHEFITYDDQDYITGNTHVRAGLTKEGFAWAFLTLRPARTYWHPLAWVSHMLDCQIFGLNAGAHHLVSLLFHTANVLLLFVLLNRMTTAFWRSAAVAALFALHPLQVDTVAWVTERKNLLSTLFWLLTMLAYERYAAAPGWRRYWPVVLCCALAFSCKAAIVTLPCVLLLLDFWPLQRFKWAQRYPRPAAKDLPRFPLTSVGRLVLEKIPFFLLAAGTIVLLFGSQHKIVAGTSSVLPLSWRIGNALVSYARYLGKTFWPENLSIFYPHPGFWPDTAVADSALLLVVISALVLWRSRRVPALLVGWLWFLGVLVPMIGILQAGDQAMADRFAYVPLIGLFIGLVWTVTDLAARWPRRVLVLGTAAALALGACVTTTSRQLGYWKDSITLFEHALSVTDDNFIAHNNLGTAYALEFRYKEAFQHFRACTELRPKFADAYCNWGIALKEQDQDLDQAKQRLHQALELDPTIEMGYTTLAGIAVKQGKWDEAIAYCQAVLRLQPDWPEALNELGLAYVQQGKLDEGSAQFLAALKAQPGYGSPHYNLGDLRLKQHRPAEAITEWRAALRDRFDWPEVLNNLAWQLSTQTNAALRDGKEAVRLASRAAELTGRTNFNVLGTLAAAYAEAGQFTNAVTAALRAEQLARATGDTNLILSKVQRVALFRSGQPVREP
jgi:tetratricopeptide (TPR) repeat protein